MAYSSASIVIAGLDPAIHKRFRVARGFMDARVEPGHDEKAE
jgi:hypothetical protein